MLSVLALSLRQYVTSLVVCVNNGLTNANFLRVHQVVAQTKEALADAGVDISKLEAAAAAAGAAAASKSVARSASTLLVKNLPYSTTGAT